jgi:hypothetical protein
MSDLRRAELLPPVTGPRDGAPRRCNVAGCALPPLASVTAGTVDGTPLRILLCAIHAEQVRAFLDPL